MAAPLCSLVSPHASSGKQPWRPAPARLAPLCLWRAPVSHGVGPQPLGTGRPYSLLLFLPWCPSRVCPSPLPLGSLLVTLLSMGAQVSSPWWQTPCQARPMSELRRLSSLLLSPWRLRLHFFYFFPSSIPPCLYASSSTPELRSSPMSTTHAMCSTGGLTRFHPRSSSVTQQVFARP